MSNEQAAWIVAWAQRHARPRRDPMTRYHTAIDRTATPVPAGRLNKRP